MKYTFFILAFLVMLLSSAQDSTNIKVEAPKIISKLMYGKTINVEDLEFKFVAVESDSRCPKGVQCVWAGEAVVLIDVFKNGKRLEQKRLVISPTSHLQTSFGNLFSSEKLTVSGFNIMPYPKHTSKINLENYYITLDVRE